MKLTGSIEFINHTWVTLIQKDGQMDGYTVDNQKSPPEFQFWWNEIMVTLKNGVNLCVLKMCKSSYAMLPFSVVSCFFCLLNL